LCLFFNHMLTISSRRTVVMIRHTNVQMRPAAPWRPLRTCVAVMSGG
jgi:hypothetical protein